MFCQKKHSWFWFAFWFLCAAGVLYLVARMFLKNVSKQARVKKHDNSASGDALFV